MEKLRAHALELVLVPCILAAGLGITTANRTLEAWTIESKADGRVGILPDGKALRALSLGFERLVADLYWLRTVYYIGDEASQASDYADAEPLAHLITDIDPHFDSVYVLMASVLNGLRYDPDAAIELLKKGTRNSDYWRIHFMLGFNYFMDKGDYVRGADALTKASELGGPTYLPLLAARLYAQGGDPETGIAFIEARLAQESYPMIIEQLEGRLRDLRIDRDLKALDAAIERFAEANGGKRPAEIAQLLEAGLIRGLPKDPDGGDYRIVDGRARPSGSYEVLEIKTD